MSILLADLAAFIRISGMHRTYLRNASLVHLPSAWMAGSFIPACAAAVATLILML